MRNMLDSKIRLAVVGGNRGSAFNKTLEYLREEVELTAICDLDEEKIAQWQKTFPDISGYTDFDEMLLDDKIDAVFIATPIDLHYEQTKKALLAGKHVLCEVYAANTLDEIEDLIKTVEDTKLVYMMAENYVYMRPNMMVYNMVQNGMFGDITYAEGGYIHDCRPIRIDEKGCVTWRGEQMRHVRGNTYPTHSLGPVAKWMGITGKDQIKKCSTFVSRQQSINEYIAQRFGKDNPAAQPGYWAHGDSVITVLECESGALIVLRFDGDSVRPHNMVHYQLQGTKASYLSGRHDGEDGLIWLEGYCAENEDGTAAKWDNLYKHSYKFEHPLWADNMKNAVHFGHGGGDFFVLKEFAQAIREKRAPFIDIYDAATWSSIVPVSIESVKKSGAPVEVPIFIRRNK